MDIVKSYKIKRPRTLKGLTKLFNKTSIEEIASCCNSDPELCYQLYFKWSFLTLKNVIPLLKLYEDGSVYSSTRKSALDGIAEEILIGNYVIARMRVVSNILGQHKRISQQEVNDLNNWLDQIQEVILEYTRKYANVVKL